jgi:hypothetical protein
MKKKYYNSIQDIKRFISDMPVHENLYVDDYIDVVAYKYVELLESKGWKSYKDEVPEILDEEFWACFECAEKEA